jgi:release factor glutamine methyltransferase
MNELFEYNGFAFQIHPKVYPPAEDTFLLAENLLIEKSDKVLEIGTGTGIIAITASKTAKKVIATDINKYAVNCAKKNVFLNKIFNVEIREGTLFEPVKNEKFDSILFNAPYLPTKDVEIIDDEINASWDGGIDGRAIIDKFINKLYDHLNFGGRIQLVQSSFSNIRRTIEMLERLGFKTVITAKKRIFFEEIVVITGFNQI